MAGVRRFNATLMAAEGSGVADDRTSTGYRISPNNSDEHKDTEQTWALMLSITTAAGSSGTLDVGVETSCDGLVWVRAQNLTQVTANTTTDTVTILTGLASWIRLNINVGGSTAPTTRVLAAKLLSDAPFSISTT